MRYRLFWLMAATLAAPSTVVAQESRLSLVELGLFGEYVNFVNNSGCPCYSPTNSVGVGGHIAYFVSDAFSVDVDASRMASELIVSGANTTYSTVSARGNVHFRLDPVGGPLSFFAGAGPVAAFYQGEDVRLGAGVIGGIRLSLDQRLIFRAAATSEYLPIDQNINATARLGANVAVGRQETSSPPVPLIIQSTAPAGPPAEPAAPPVSPAGMAILDAPVYFDFDRSRLRPDAIEALEAKIPWLRSNPEVRIRLEGNADDRGTTAYNIPLALDRSIAVRDYLVAAGFSTNRFEIISFGDTRLRCEALNDEDGCDQLNRRVDFEVVTPDIVIRNPQD